MVGDPTNVLRGTRLNPPLSFTQLLASTATVARAILAVNTSMLYLKSHGFLHRDALRRHRERQPLQLPSPSGAVKDRGLLQVSMVSLGLAVSFLIVHTFLGVSAALATLLPSFIILVYESSRQSELRDVLGRVDWQVCVFFGGLSILVARFATPGLLSG